MATKDKSVIVSGMGVGMSIIQSLVGKAQRRGVSDEVIHSLATPDGDALLNQFVEIMAGARHAANDSYFITVNYNLPLEQMIASGHYDWANNDITAKRFPITGEGVIEYEAKLFHFDRAVPSEQVIEAITSADTANPWEPGKIEHLCALGEKYPEEQGKYPIIALGSSRGVSGSRSVPYLSRRGSERRLSLLWWVDAWRGVYRFLAVRQISGS